MQGVGAVPPERRQHPHPHRRHAVRAPRRARAAVRGGPRPAVHLLLRHARPFSPRYIHLFKMLLHGHVTTLSVPNYKLFQKIWKVKPSQRNIKIYDIK